MTAVVLDHHTMQSVIKLLGVAALALPALAQTATTTLGNSTDSTITSTLTSTSTITASPSLNCTASCGAYAFEYSWYWRQNYYSTTITAATLIYVINNRTNTTSTITSYNELPSGYTLPAVNSAGTQITTLAVTGFDNQTTITTL